MTHPTPTGTFRPSLRSRPLLSGLVALGLVGAGLVGQQGNAAESVGSTTGWSWYKTDTHVHSVVSGDGLDDVGVIARAAQARGYDALFLTDHQAGSNFAISTVVANHVVFDDDLGSKWDLNTSGVLSASTNATATTPVNTGTASLRLAASSTSSGETFRVLKRGPNLRSGDVLMTFAVYPTRIDRNSGLYVSMSLGGDRTDDVPDGYTSQDGVVHPGRSTVFVWQLGSARAPSSLVEQRVIVNNLGYRLNRWNTYTVNVSQAVAEAFPNPGDRPVDFNALSRIKMSAQGNQGTAEGYFDSLHVDASAAVPSGQEFASRNASVSTFDTPSFRIYPSVEMGYNRHAQRFNFGITNAAAYDDFFQCDATGRCAITRGIDGIRPTQDTHYPAQLNHPDLPGGVTAAEALATQAGGADTIESRDPTMIAVWEDLMMQGLVLPGSWSSDMHKVETLDAAGRGTATYLYAQSLGLDHLIRSMYEGRSFNAGHAFPGKLTITADSTSAEPAATRYPIRVSPATTQAAVQLRITSGIPAGAQLVWIRNAVPLSTENLSGASFDGGIALALEGPFTWVRAELRDAGGGVLAMSQPLWFVPDATLPAGVAVATEGVETPDGRGYTRLETKGAVSSAFDAAAGTLRTDLVAPAGSLTTLRISTQGRVPGGVFLDGAAVSAAASRAEFDTSSVSTWFYDPGVGQLRVKARQLGSAAVLSVETTGAADTTPPSAPTRVSGTAEPGVVHLSWTRSTDDLGVQGYTLFRDGTALVNLPDIASYDDTGVLPGRTYSYEVQAFDGAGNRSTRAPVPPLQVGVPSVRATTFVPVADAYVDTSAPTLQTGSSTRLRVDADPTVRSLLRFDVQALEGTPYRATLRLLATSSQGTGVAAHGLTGAWTESGVTAANAPTFGPTVAASAAAVSGSWLSVDVTPLVPSSGIVEVGIDTPSMVALALASREAGSASAPQLVVETALPTDPSPSPSAAPSPDASPSPSPSPSPAVSPSPSPSPSCVPVATRIFNAVADSTVDASTPLTNSGNAVKLRADASPLVRSLLRFEVAGTSGPVTRATLSLLPTSGSSSGVEARAIPYPWSESTVSASSAGDFSPTVVGRSGRLVQGTTVRFDVSPLVTGNGTVDVGLTTTSTIALSVASREAAVGVATLEVQTGDATCTGTPPGGALRTSDTARRSAGRPDRELPTLPRSLGALAKDVEEVVLTWQPSRDDVAVMGYAVRRDGELIGTTPAGATRYLDTTVHGNVVYHYTVAAFDAAGRHSVAATAPPVLTRADDD